MPRQPNMTIDPVAMGINAMTLAALTTEAQAVIAMRVLGMAGLWPVTRGENQRMVSEKVAALGQSQIAMWRATMAQKSPDDILAAGLKPLRRKTRANAKRLTRRAFG